MVARRLDIQTTRVDLGFENISDVCESYRKITASIKIVSDILYQASQRDSADNPKRLINAFVKPTNPLLSQADGGVEDQEALCRSFVRKLETILMDINYFCIRSELGPVFTHLEIIAKQLKLLCKSQVNLKMDRTPFRVWDAREINYISERSSQLLGAIAKARGMFLPDSK